MSDEPLFATDEQNAELVHFYETIVLNDDREIIDAEGLEQVNDYYLDLYTKHLQRLIDTVRNDRPRLVALHAEMVNGEKYPMNTSEDMYAEMMNDIRAGNMLARKFFFLMRVSEFLSYSEDRASIPHDPEELVADVDRWWEQRNRQNDIQNGGSNG
jgi:hypothetical protein